MSQHLLVETLMREVQERPLLWIAVALFANTLVKRVLAWHRLRHIDGPFWAKFTDFWLLKRLWRSELYVDLGKAVQEYGNVVRIARNYVVCGDPAEIRRIWGVRSTFDRSDWYRAFRWDPPQDSSLTIRDPTAHPALRAKLAPGYGGRGVEGLHEAVDEGIEQLIQLIETEYLSTDSEYKPVDFAVKTQYMTLDIITKIAFGDALGFLAADSDLYGYVERWKGKAVMPASFVIALHPWLVSILHSDICKPLRPTDQDKEGFGALIAFAKRLVAKRYGPNKVVKNDMLGTFVQNGLTQSDAEAESLVQVIAGSDTTVGALRSIIAHIISSPALCRRVQEEIDNAIADGRVSTPVADAEARKLPMLQACIKEGLRIWPPITAPTPRVSNVDATICGVHIPAGTNVCWSAWAILRNKEVFGPDADVFRPDRWLQADEKRVLPMNETVDLCFAHGKNGCLGRPIAMIELNKAIVEFLRRWDITIVNREHPIDNYNCGILVQSDFWVTIQKRKIGL
ncbi:hypothetical protein OQA88_8263 [Cercophora sp. LCS_1]